MKKEKRGNKKLPKQFHRLEVTYIFKKERMEFWKAFLKCFMRESRFTCLLYLEFLYESIYLCYDSLKLYYRRSSNGENILWKLVFKMLNLHRRESTLYIVSSYLFIHKICNSSLIWSDVSYITSQRLTETIIVSKQKKSYEVIEPIESIREESWLCKVSKYSTFSLRRENISSEENEVISFYSVPVFNREMRRHMRRRCLGLNVSVKHKNM